MRDGGLLHLDFSAEFTHRTSTSAQPRQYLDPAGRRESPHEASYLLGGAPCKRARDGRVVGFTHVFRCGSGDRQQPRASPTKHHLVCCSKGWSWESGVPPSPEAEPVS
jgi:hypothetical protein